MSKENNSKLNICYVYIFPIPEEKGDFATLVPIRMAKILQEKANIHVLYSGYINKEKLKKNGITAWQYSKSMRKLSLVRLFSLIYYIYQLAKEEQIDVFSNVWSHYFLFPVIIGAKLARKKTVARIAGLPITPHLRNISLLKSIKRRIGLWIEKKSLKKADYIHSLSPFLKQTFIEKEIAPSKLATISQGVDTQKFQPQSDERLSEVKKILFVGRLERSKNLETLLRAFSFLEKELDNVKLVIVGEGEQENNLKQFSKKLNLYNRVEFRGYMQHEKLPRIYNSSNILVLPSQSEGSPNAILEAFACGTPVVGTEVGSISNLLANGKGITVPPESPQALAEAMNLLLADEKLRKEMGEKGRNYVKKEHSFKAVREKYLKMFQELSDNKKL